MTVQTTTSGTGAIPVDRETLLAPRYRWVAVGMFALGTSPMAALLIDMGFGPDEKRERLDVIEADS